MKNGAVFVTREVLEKGVTLLQSETCTTSFWGFSRIGGLLGPKICNLKPVTHVLQQ